MQIYKTTTRVSELLKNWTQTSSAPAQLIANCNESFQWKFEFNGGGSCQNVALVATALCELLTGKPYSAIEEMSLRELDYYLRDKSRESIFNDQARAQVVFNQVKEMLCQSIFHRLESINKKSLGIRAFSYQVALDLYSYQNDIKPSSLVLSDFEESDQEALIVIDFEKGLDKKTEHIEMLGGHFVDLFQDDHFNVIPV